MEEFRLQNLQNCPGCGDTLSDELQESDRIYCDECTEKHDEMFQL